MAAAANSFDIILYAYDSPEALNQWLNRLFNHTDFCRYAGDGQLIVADTGTPLDRFGKIEEVVKTWGAVRPITLLRTDTDHIRKRVDPRYLLRVIGPACNQAARLAESDVLLFTALGMIFPPDYFSQLLSYHQADDVFLQPAAFRVVSSRYHSELRDADILSILRSGEIQSRGGLPDFSLRREHYLRMGGLDEAYTVWGMIDIDMCARATGLLETKEPVHVWASRCVGKVVPPYSNYGLRLERPFNPLFYSLNCMEYPGRDSLSNDARRQASLSEVSRPYFFSKWGQVCRNM